MDVQDLPLKAFVLNRCFAEFATLLVVVLLLRSEQIPRRVRDLARRHPFATLRTDASPRSRPCSSSSFLLRSFQILAKSIVCQSQLSRKAPRRSTADSPPRLYLKGHRYGWSSLEKVRTFGT